MFSTLAKRFSKTNVRVASRYFSSSSNNRGPVTFLSLALTGAVAGGMLLYYEIEKEEKMKQVTKNVQTTGKPALGGPWVLVDHNVRNYIVIKVIFKCM